MPTDCINVTELASALNLPASALIAAVETNRKTLKKAYYTIPELAQRWNCSRATVYNILKESEFKLLSLVRKGKVRGKHNVPASVVEHIEKSRMNQIDADSSRAA